MEIKAIPPLASPSSNDETAVVCVTNQLMNCLAKEKIANEKLISLLELLENLGVSELKIGTDLGHLFGNFLSLLEKPFKKQSFIA